jgi:hypothetical protein
MRGVWARVLLLCLVAACGTDVGHAPVARIAASPRAVPEQDSFQTEVTLDGRASADPIDDPDGERPLVYTWEISGDESSRRAWSDQRTGAHHHPFRRPPGHRPPHRRG